MGGLNFSMHSRQSVARRRTHLRDLHGRHGIDVETEDFGAVEAHHEALHLLLVDGEVARLDVQVAVAGEAQHGLALSVPGHAVGIWLLEGKQNQERNTSTLSIQRKHTALCSFYGGKPRGPATALSSPNLKKQFFADNVVDQEGVVLVHHGQLFARGAHVQASD